MDFQISARTADGADSAGLLVLLHFHTAERRKACRGLFFLLGFGGKQMVLGEINICFCFLHTEYWLF